MQLLRHVIYSMLGWYSLQKRIFIIVNAVLDRLYIIQLKVLPR